MTDMKQGKMILKKLKFIMTTLLAVVMVMGLMPLSASAAATGITVKDATYYPGGALQSLTANFGWDTGRANVQLVLMKNMLNTTTASSPEYGDFTDSGTYRHSFTSYGEAVAYDVANDNIFGIIAPSETKYVDWHSSGNELSINLAESHIPLNQNGLYYIYFWTSYMGHYYPDNLFCAIQVNNGAVKYAPATDRNSYDETKFDQIISQTKYAVTVTPAANMTRAADSGDESQVDLDGAMTPVVYTADENYYFPEDYAVATENGIMVKRDSESQITVYGTPSSDAAITLTAPSRRVLDLEEVLFHYAYDAQRNPAYPTQQGDKITMSGLKNPFNAAGNNDGMTNEGTWTLSQVGNYARMEANDSLTSGLTNIVTAVADNYNLDDKGTVIIHELKDGETHIAYGVVVAYDAAEGYAAFIGDSLERGAGYLLSIDPVSETEKDITAGAIATDFIETAKTPEPTPAAVFTASSENGGTLTNIESGMKYSIDGGTTWTDVTETTITLTNVTTENDIKVIRIGNGTTTIDSDVQTIDVTQAEKPTGLTGTDCTDKNQNNGKITGIDSTMEYKLSTADNWTSVPDDITNGTLTGLANGTYQVRVKANGTVLTSPTTEVTVNRHSCTAQSGWKSDDKEHWKTCTCGEKLNTAAHTFKWITDKKATETTKGSKHEECSVCGYKKKAVEIPATGTATKPTAPTKPADTVKAVKTGDSTPVGLICGITLLTAAGFILLTVRHKKNFR